MTLIAMPSRAGSVAPIGAQLRNWRLRRRLSQLDLALDAGISQRHLSFVESGRAAPSRDMVLHLAEQLEVPLRERNMLLLAAGFAPRFSDRPLDDPALAAARGVVEAILRAHVPHPALAVDRHWTMVAANEAVAPLLAGVRDAALLRAPVNVLRLSLHPGGLARAIANLQQWRAHVLGRLRRQVIASADPILAALLTELSDLAPDGRDRTVVEPFKDEIAIPLELDTAQGRLSLISTTTVFGTPTEVTLSELAIEAFYPADGATVERLQRLNQPQPGAR
ncbi:MULTISPECIES: helix-turn-helix domain-containing protein [unclassified Acidisoma]|uniref:MmyB family transcriptional regulator n=1 Tax=unclassified Acidisoma TaxID=2634065 RepID=UPI00131DB5F9|nr:MULTISPECIES: helix-turn-helix domain-containing protein [unclassified Acidisoma]